MLAGDAVRRDVAQVVDDQQGAGQQPTGTAATQATRCSRSTTHVRRADRGHEAEEHEHEQLAQPEVAVRAWAAGVEPGRGDRRDADDEQPPRRRRRPAPEPATAATPKATNAARFTAPRRGQPGGDEPNRPDAVVVGAAHAVAVVVGVVHADLQGQAHDERRRPPATSTDPARPRRRPCRRPPARPPRAACGAGAEDPSIRHRPSLPVRRHPPATGVHPPDATAHRHAWSTPARCAAHPPPLCTHRTESSRRSDTPLCTAPTSSCASALPAAQGSGCGAGARARRGGACRARCEGWLRPGATRGAHRTPAAGSLHVHGAAQRRRRLRIGGHDEGDDALAPLRVVGAGDGDVGDPGGVEQHLLDRLRPHVLAPGDDHLAGAAEDDQPAVVPRAGVARRPASRRRPAAPTRRDTARSSIGPRRRTWPSASTRTSTPSSGTPS